MPWTSPSNPTSGTVITVAYAVANLLDPIRWLRLMTGNADPPGTNYVVTSDSVAAASWKTGLGAVAGVLGYTPANKAGDSFSGPTSVIASTAGHAIAVQNTNAAGLGLAVINAAGSGFDLNVRHDAAVFGVPVQPDAGISLIAPAVLSGTGTLNAGTTAAGTVSAARFLAGPSGITSAGAISAGTAAIATAGQIDAGAYNGGTTAAGTVSAARFLAGLSGITSAGAVQAPVVDVGSGGVNATGQIQTTIPDGNTPLLITSRSRCVNLNADMTDGAHASATPAAGTIPIADAAGKLDAWISPSGLAGVPTGIAVLWSGPAGNDGSPGNIPSGWTRFSALDGRVPVGAGTTASVAWAANAATGSSWSHAHTTPAHAHSGAPLTISGSTGAASGTGNQTNIATPNPASATQGHTHDQGNLDVAGNTATDGSGTSGAPAWDFPSYAAIWIRKT